MSDELKSILSEIAFPVRYDSKGRYIMTGNNEILADIFSQSPAFGHELARLINTLDPKRESVTDEEIEKAFPIDDNVMSSIQMAFNGGKRFGAKWYRDKLSGLKT